MKIAAPFPQCLHSPVIAEYLFSASLYREVLENERERYVWYKGNYAAISEGLAEFNWIYEFNCLSVNDCFN